MRDFVRNPIVESISVQAPLERCWQLSVCVELVQKTLGMRPVAGVTSGPVTANSRVRWKGWKLGMPTEHNTLITSFEPPHVLSSGGRETAMEAFFQDTQEKGRFAFFQHDHHFHQHGSDGPVTELRDKVRFSLPFGVLGRIAATTLLAPYISSLARARFAMIKRLAEGDGWREWVAEGPAPAAANGASHGVEVMQ